MSGARLLLEFHFGLRPGCWRSVDALLDVIGKSPLAGVHLLTERFSLITIVSGRYHIYRSD